METKHTKGEWKYDGKYCVIFYEGNTDTQNKDCELWRHQYATQAEIVANAKLISAAPDLLEACKELIEYMEYHGYTQARAIDTAKLAIKKATE